MYRKCGNLRIVQLYLPFSQMGFLFSFLLSFTVVPNPRNRVKRAGIKTDQSNQVKVCGMSLSSECLGSNSSSDNV